MKPKGLSQLPVIDNGNCVGLITIDSILNSKNAKKVKEAMINPPPIISEDEILELAINAGAEDCTLGTICERYYNPAASSDDGSCRYYQAPHGDDVNFVVNTNGITVDWSGFTPPTNAIVSSYHVQRCLESCTWLPGFTAGDQSTSTSVLDNCSFK